MGKQQVLGQTSLKGDTAHLLEKRHIYNNGFRRITFLVKQVIVELTDERPGQLSESQIRQLVFPTNELSEVLANLLY